MIKLILALPLLLLSSFAFFSTPLDSTTPVSEIAICHSMPEENNTFLEDIPNDPAKAHSMPLLAKTAKGEVMLSWTEKDAQGMISFCVAFSKDNGKTFSEKKTIYSGTGIGNSRMMRAKVLSKKDGSFVAVFTNRGEAAAASSGRGGGRSSNLVYCISKDGTTWTAPQSVDSDPKQGIVRGFFDAVLMSNDEIAVAYLKDVVNSTKHEERDLRLVVSKNGVMQPEKLIDPVVCDCCPINLFVDGSGALNVIYRDNNDNIRDMAKMVSTDNAETFSKSQILYNDGWKIMGCPHSGAVSSTTEKGTLISWFSGAESEKGIRLATQDGKKLLVINEPSAKNQALVSGAQASVLLWEQNKAEDGLSQIAFRKINNGKVSETAWIEESLNGTNAVGLAVGNQLLVAYEVKQANGKNNLKVSTIAL
jgi:hypothetical protein